MTTPITPQNAIDQVVLHKINISYKPVWDGAAWVVTLADIEINGIGNAGTAGVNASGASVVMAGTDLPAGGQSAIQQLYQFIEQAVADNYP